MARKEVTGTTQQSDKKLRTKGRITEQGSHEELMTEGVAYRHMVELQEQMKSWNGEASA